MGYFIHTLPGFAADPIYYNIAPEGQLLQASGGFRAVLERILGDTCYLRLDGVMVFCGNDLPGAAVSWEE